MEDDFVFVEAEEEGEEVTSVSESPVMVEAPPLPPSPPTVSAPAAVVEKPPMAAAAAAVEADPPKPLKAAPRPTPAPKPTPKKQQKSTKKAAPPPAPAPQPAAPQTWTFLRPPADDAPSDDDEQNDGLRRHAVLASAYGSLPSALMPPPAHHVVTKAPQPAAAAPQRVPVARVQTTKLASIVGTPEPRAGSVVAVAGSEASFGRHEFLHRVTATASPPQSVGAPDTPWDAAAVRFPDALPSATPSVVQEALPASVPLASLLVTLSDLHSRGVITAAARGALKDAVLDMVYSALRRGPGLAMVAASHVAVGDASDAGSQSEVEDDGESGDELHPLETVMERRQEDTATVCSTFPAPPFSTVHSLHTASVPSDDSDNDACEPVGGDLDDAGREPAPLNMGSSIFGGGGVDMSNVDNVGMELRAAASLTGSEVGSAGGSYALQARGGGAASVASTSASQVDVASVDCRAGTPGYSRGAFGGRHSSVGASSVTSDFSLLHRRFGWAAATQATEASDSDGEGGDANTRAAIGHRSRAASVGVTFSDAGDFYVYDDDGDDGDDGIDSDDNMWAQVPVLSASVAAARGRQRPTTAARRRSSPPPAAWGSPGEGGAGERRARPIASSRLQRRLHTTRSPSTPSWAQQVALDSELKQALPKL